jgi:hypothetical protein
MPGEWQVVDPRPARETASERIMAPVIVVFGELVLILSDRLSIEGFRAI